MNEIKITILEFPVHCPGSPEDQYKGEDAGNEVVSTLLMYTLTSQ